MEKVLEKNKLKKDKGKKSKKRGEVNDFLLVKDENISRKKKDDFYGLKLKMFNMKKIISLLNLLGFFLELLVRLMFKDKNWEKEKEVRFLLFFLLINFVMFNLMKELGNRFGILKKGFDKGIVLNSRE